jgi:hypothetical protein
MSTMKKNLPRELLTMIDEVSSIDSKMNLRKATGLGWKRMKNSNFEWIVETILQNRVCKGHPYERFGIAVWSDPDSDSEIDCVEALAVIPIKDNNKRIEIFEYGHSREIDENDSDEDSNSDISEAEDEDYFEWIRSTKMCDFCDHMLGGYIEGMSRIPLTEKYCQSCKTKQEAGTIDLHEFEQMKRIMDNRWNLRETTEML